VLLKEKGEVSASSGLEMEKGLKLPIKALKIIKFQC
jgi:hypothetical protein